MVPPEGHDCGRLNIAGASQCVLQVAPSPAIPPHKPICTQPFPGHPPTVLQLSLRVSSFVSYATQESVPTGWEPAIPGVNDSTDA